MTMTAQRPGSFWVGGAPAPLRWQIWPLKKSPVATATVLLGVAGIGLLVHQITGKLHLDLLAVGVVVVALWRFFLPVTFGLSEDGVDQWVLGRHTRIPWEAVRRYEVCRSGVLLLPFADSCALDALHGLYLPWNGHRDAVLATIRFHVGSGEKA